MGTVSVSFPADGTTIDVADYNNPITTIVNEINGNLDNANIKTGAAIATSKLADDAGITPAKWSNPYKFRARRTSAVSTTGSAAKMVCDTEDFDTNNNFASGTYTAPVAGFYLFNMYFNVAGSTNIVTLYKNGSAYQRGTQAGSGGTNSTFFVQSAANDTWDFYFTGTSVAAVDVTAGVQPFFEGFLVTQT